MKSPLLVILLISFYSTLTAQNPILEAADSSFYDQTKIDSTKTGKHSIYAEPWLFGRIGTLGYSYDFYSTNRWRLSASAGFGMLFNFKNPDTYLFFPIGVEADISVSNRFSVNFGVYNFIYLNYWTYFSDVGKDCTGRATCPQDEEFLNLMAFLGVNWRFKSCSLSPRVYLNIYGTWDQLPFPALKLKYHL